MALSSKRTWVVRGLVGLVAVYVLYLLAVGLFTTVAGQSYKAPAEAPADDRAKAACIAEALVQPLEEELDGAFGWLPNDILLVPRIIDNKTSFQLGVIYATRSKTPGAGGSSTTAKSATARALQTGACGLPGSLASRQSRHRSTM